MSGIVNAHTITHATVGHVGKTLKLNKKKMEKNGQAARDWSRPATGGKRIQLVGFNSRHRLPPSPCTHCTVLDGK